MGTTTSPCKWLQSDYLISYGSILSLSIGKATENDPTPEIGSDRISLSHQIFISPLSSVHALTFPSTRQTRFVRRQLCKKVFVQVSRGINPDSSSRLFVGQPGVEMGLGPFHQEEEAAAVL